MIRHMACRTGISTLPLATRTMTDEWVASLKSYASSALGLIPTLRVYRTEFAMMAKMVGLLLWGNDSMKPCLGTRSNGWHQQDNR